MGRLFSFISKFAIYYALVSNVTSVRGRKQEEKKNSNKMVKRGADLASLTKVMSSQEEQSSTVGRSPGAELVPTKGDRTQSPVDDCDPVDYEEGSDGNDPNQQEKKQDNNSCGNTTPVGSIKEQAIARRVLNVDPEIEKQADNELMKKEADKIMEELRIQKLQEYLESFKKKSKNFEFDFFETSPLLTMVKYQKFTDVMQDDKYWKELYYRWRNTKASSSKKKNDKPMTEKELKSSWNSFLTLCFEGRMEQVIAKAEERIKKQKTFSLIGLRELLHEYAIKNKILCDVAITEKRCASAGHDSIYCRKGRRFSSQQIEEDKKKKEKITDPDYLSLRSRYLQRYEEARAENKTAADEAKARSQQPHQEHLSKRQKTAPKYQQKDPNRASGPYSSAQSEPGSCDFGASVNDYDDCPMDDLRDRRSSRRYSESHLDYHEGEAVEPVGHVFGKDIYPSRRPQVDSTVEVRDRPRHQHSDAEIGDVYRKIARLERHARELFDRVDFLEKENRSLRDQVTDLESRSEKGTSHDRLKTYQIRKA